MKLTPYVFFYGRCEEALKFYAGVFHGTYEAMRNGDGPMKDHVPAETHDKIMHAKFTAPGIEFMAADGRATQAIDPDAGNITLAVEADEAAEGDRLFQALSAGGKVTMPLDAAFWGGRFGMLVDRFGNEWMLTAP